ncbi:unnamed protein product [Closterium sp. NIES-65]|nr:unnamed protein product [Closterium sp. NIES-65]
MGSPVAALLQPQRRPFSGPVAAHSAAPSPPFQRPRRHPPFQRPRRRPSAAPSPPFRGPIAALSAARRRPFSARLPPFQRPVAAPFSGPIAALPRSRRCSAAQRPSRRAAQPPSSRAAEQPSRPTAEPPCSQAARPPSRRGAEPPDRRAALQPSRPAAEPPSRTAAEALPPVGLPGTAPLAWKEQRLCHCTALPHCNHCLSTVVMASPSVLTFDAEGQAIDFEVWVDDLQLFLQCDRADGLSLFDLTSGASPAPAADANATVRSQWATRDAAARLAVRRHLLTTERAHFSQYKSAQTLYDAVVDRYSSLATAALSRLMLPYLFPDLAAFPTVADLITHLRTSDTCYRAALPAELCAKNHPPMYITLYYIDTQLPDSLRVVRDHFLSVCPTTLTVDLLEKALLAAEKSIVGVGASRGDHRTPVFKGCSPSPLLPSVASVAAADLVGFESVGAASAPSGRPRTGKGKGGKGAGGAGGGGGDGGGGSGGSGGGGGSDARVAAAAAAVEAAVAVVVAEGAEAAEVAEVAEEAEVEEAAEAAATAVVERVATLRRGVAQVVVRASSSGVV